MRASLLRVLDVSPPPSKWTHPQTYIGDRAGGSPEHPLGHREQGLAEGWVERPGGKWGVGSLNHMSASQRRSHISMVQPYC